MRIIQEDESIAEIYFNIFAYNILYIVKKLGNKKLTTIRADEELLKKAHDLGLNVSKISENAIKDAIERMERKA